MSPTITQADRKAAASLVTLAELRPMLLSGSHDDHPYIQAFAAHCEAERDAIVAWLRSEQGKGSDAGIDYAEDFAEAIERGEHNAKGE